MIFFLSGPPLSESFVTPQDWAVRTNSEYGWWRIKRLRQFRLDYRQQTIRLTASAASSEEDRWIPSTPGLLPVDQFERLQSLHTTLTNLRMDLPLVLKKPLPPQHAVETYAKDVTLVGPNDEILASGLEELKGISEAIVAASIAGRTARDFADTFRAELVSDSTGTTGVDAGGDIVECELVLREDLSSLQVDWVTPPLPGLGLGGGGGIMGGTSVLELNEQGLVQTHRLVNVAIDGREINAMGETLATLRRAVKSVEDMPFAGGRGLVGGAGGSVWEGIMKELRDGLMGQSDLPDSSEGIAPLFLDGPELAAPHLVNTSTSTSTSPMVLDINLALRINGTVPLPGSDLWPIYALSHQSLANFLTNSIPLLAGTSDAAEDTRYSLEELFTPEAKMIGLDGVVLLSGREQVSDYYRSISRFRAATNGDWDVVNATANRESMQISISWISKSPVMIEGIDVFTLESLSTAEDGEVSVTSGRIQRINQTEMRVQGNPIRDPEWMKRFLFALDGAQAAGMGGPAVDRLVEFMRLVGGPTNTMGAAPVKRRPVPPKLSAEASANLYGIMRDLHVLIPTVADLENTASSSLPASLYLSDRVELRGLLSELLARGPDAYRRAVNLAISTFRATVQTGRIRLEEKDGIVPTVELTAKGNIRLKVELRLFVNAIAPTPSLPGIIPGSTKRDLPVTLELLSEYILNDEGLIREHRLSEGRVNGIRSPADVISSWFSGADGLSPLAERGVEESSPTNVAFRTFLEALNWR